jgi:hypothetical protein
MKFAGFRIAVGVAAILIFFTGVFSATFFLTSILYQAVGRQPSAFAVQLINVTVAQPGARCFLGGMN